MQNMLWYSLIVVTLTKLVAGCSDPGLDSAHPGLTEIKSDHEQASVPSAQRLMLNEGYSLLYTDAGLLDRAGLLLYAKAESDEIDEIISTVAAFGEALQKDMERISRDYPGVRLDLDPLPEMEKRKRRALTMNRVRYFTPIIGHGGREYERTLLISIANGINHQRHPTGARLSRTMFKFMSRVRRQPATCRLRGLKENG
ncbi:MAG: hypothetical protein ACOY9J_02700 [Pseudomonadota bacterium]